MPPTDKPQLILPSSPSRLAPSSILIEEHRDCWTPTASFVPTRCELLVDWNNLYISTPCYSPDFSCPALIWLFFVLLGLGHSLLRTYNVLLQRHYNSPGPEKLIIIHPTTFVDHVRLKTISSCHKATISAISCVILYKILFQESCTRYPPLDKELRFRVQPDLYCP